MAASTEWDLVRTERSPRLGEAGVSPVRVALLFGSAAVAVALLAVPVLDRSTKGRVASNAVVDDLDLISTGSIARPGKSYTIRRSVLQSSPTAVCVIGGNGARSGDC